jgi:hypothetical protein
MPAGPPFPPQINSMQPRWNSGVSTLELLSGEAALLCMILSRLCIRDFLRFGLTSRAHWQLVFGSAKVTVGATSGGIGSYQQPALTMDALAAQLLAPLYTLRDWHAATAARTATARDTDGGPLILSRDGGRRPGAEGASEQNSWSSSTCGCCAGMCLQQDPSVSGVSCCLACICPGLIVYRNLRGSLLAGNSTAEGLSTRTVRAVSGAACGLTGVAALMVLAILQDDTEPDLHCQPLVKGAPGVCVVGWGICMSALGLLLLWVRRRIAAQFHLARSQVTDVVACLAVNCCLYSCTLGQEARHVADRASTLQDAHLHNRGPTRP